MFYRNWDNFSKYHVMIEEEEEVPLPEFELRSIWVNHQNQHDLVPSGNYRAHIKAGDDSFQFIDDLQYIIDILNNIL